MRNTIIIIKLVDRVLFSKQTKDTSKLESDVDKMVFELYGLTEKNNGGDLKCQIIVLFATLV